MTSAANAARKPSPGRHRKRSTKLPTSVEVWASLIVTVVSVVIMLVITLLWITL